MPPWKPQISYWCYCSSRTNSCSVVSARTGKELLIFRPGLGTSITQHRKVFGRSEVRIWDRRQSIEYKQSFTFSTFPGVKCGKKTLKSVMISSYCLLFESWIILFFYAALQMNLNKQWTNQLRTNTKGKDAIKSTSLYPCWLLEHYSLASWPYLLDWRAIFSVVHRRHVSFWLAESCVYL